MPVNRGETIKGGQPLTTQQPDDQNSSMVLQQSPNIFQQNMNNI